MGLLSIFSLHRHVCVFPYIFASISGSMTRREILLGASAAQYMQGEFSKAAKLIETSLIEHPQDALSLRLAQNCYLATGDSYSALRCLARSMHTFDEKRR